jgi:hypothetical protein
MPTPTRTTIKDAIVTAIKGDTTIASTRVTKGRYNVPDGASFPQVFVWMMRETAETQTMTRSRTEMRTMDVAVDYWAKAATSSALEDAFDVACDAIKAAVCGGTGLVGVARQDILLTGTEFIYEGDEDTPFGCARLTFTVKYISSEP